MKIIKNGLLLVLGILVAGVMGGCSKKTDGPDVKTASENENGAEQSAGEKGKPGDENTRIPRDDDSISAIYGPPEMLGEPAEPIDEKQEAGEIPSDIDQSPQLIYGPPEMLNGGKDDDEPEVGKPELQDTEDDNPDRIIEEYQKLPDHPRPVAKYGIRPLYGVQSPRVK